MLLLLPKKILKFPTSFVAYSSAHLNVIFGQYHLMNLVFLPGRALGFLLFFLVDWRKPYWISTICLLPLLSCIIMCTNITEKKKWQACSCSYIIKVTNFHSLHQFSLIILNPKLAQSNLKCCHNAHGNPVIRHRTSKYGKEITKSCENLKSQCG